MSYTGYEQTVRCWAHSSQALIKAERENLLLYSQDTGLILRHVVSERVVKLAVGNLCLWGRKARLRWGATRTCSTPKAGYLPAALDGTGWYSESTLTSPDRPKYCVKVPPPLRRAYQVLLLVRNTPRSAFTVPRHSRRERAGPTPSPTVSARNPTLLCSVYQIASLGRNTAGSALPSPS